MSIWKEHFKNNPTKSLTTLARRTRGLFLLVLLLSSAHLSCSRKADEEGKGSFTITLPKTAGVPGLAIRSNSVSVSSTEWGLARPSSMDSISCFAIFIGKTDANDPNQCSDSNAIEQFDFYMGRGLLPSGASLTLPVESGATKITILGLAAINPASDCIDMQGPINKARYSQPLVVGSGQLDVVPNVDNDVTINVSLTTSSSNIQDCTGLGGLTGTPLPPSASALTVTGLPAANATSLNIQVGGTDIYYYKYKVGMGALCSIDSGYSSEFPVATLLTSSLGADGVYSLCIVGRNSSGVWLPLSSAYSHIWTKSTDATVPTISAPTLSILNLTSTSTDLSWTAASDDTTSAAQLEYRAFISAAGVVNPSTLNSVAFAESATPVSNWSTLNNVSVSGLAANTGYTMAIVVRDLNGNKSVYTPVVVTTLSGLALAIQSPSSGAIIANSASVALSGSCSIEGSSLLIKVNTVGTGCSTTCSSGSWTLSSCNLNAQPEGSLSVTVYDGVTTSIIVTLIKDTVSPVVSTPTLTPSNFTTASLDIGFAPASDAVSATPLLVYRLFRSAAGISSTAAMDTVAEAESATAIGSWVANASSLSVSGLSANTTYTFAVVVRDENNNKSIYTPLVATTNSGSSLAISSPSGGSYINQGNQNALMISGTCPIHSSTVSIKINGNLTGCSTTCSSGGWSISVCNLSGEAEGALTATAWDGTNTSGGISLTKDTVAPSTPTGLSVGTVVGGLTSSPSISWGASSDSNGISLYEVQLINPPSTTVAGWAIKSSGSTLTGLSLTAGTSYLFEVRAKDIPGNYSTIVQSSTWNAQNLPTKLDVVGLASDTVGTCRVYSVSTLDASNNAVNLASGVTANLSVTAGTGGFYSNSGCTSGISSVVISAGSGSTSFYYKSTSAGSHTIQGADNAANLTTGTKNITISALSLSVVAVYPSFGANWNDYITYSSSGSPDYQQSDTACAGTETGYYGLVNGCLHGGEKKKVVVTGVGTCTNLTITDALGVFDWSCVMISGDATFISKGLKPGKGLRDLVSASAWNNNSVTVLLNGNSYGNSASTTWWGNPVSGLPDNSISGTVSPLPAGGTIYTLSSSRDTFGYEITADKVAIVTLGSSNLTHDGSTATNTCNTATGTSASPNNKSFIFGGGRKYLWVEASVGGVNGAWTAHSGLTMVNWKYSRVHNTQIHTLHTNVTHHGIYLRDSKYNLLTATSVFTASGGLHFYSDSSTNILRDIKVASTVGSSSTAMIRMENISSSNKFYDLSLSNNTNSTSAYGVHILGNNDYNYFTRLRISNLAGTGTQSDGVYIQGNTANYNVFSQLVVHNLKHSGVRLEGSQNNYFGHLTIGNSNGKGIYFDASDNNNNTLNSLAIFNTANSSIAANVTSTTGVGNIFENVALSNDGAYTVDSQSVTMNFDGYFVSDIPDCLTSSNNFLSTACDRASAAAISGTVSGAFIGRVTGTDSINGSGTQSFSTLNTLIKWLDFEFPFRGWGSEDGSFPSTASHGPCYTGSCRIWDWRVPSGSSFLGKSIDGINNKISNFTTGGACMTGINGAAVDALTFNSMTFLKNAIEIDQDDVGNDNSLCETSENCIYAPNVGSYQGQGNVNGTPFCTTNGGSVPSVNIYKMPTIGI